MKVSFTASIKWFAPQGERALMHSCLAKEGQRYTNLGDKKH